MFEKQQKVDQPLRPKNQVLLLVGFAVPRTWTSVFPTLFEWLAKKYNVPAMCKINV